MVADLPANSPFGLRPAPGARFRTIESAPYLSALSLILYTNPLAFAKESY
jgi:hypothetical protein